MTPSVAGVESEGGLAAVAIASIRLMFMRPEAAEEVIPAIAKMTLAESVSVIEVGSEPTLNDAVAVSGGVGFVVVHKETRTGNNQVAGGHGYGRGHHESDNYYQINEQFTDIYDFILLIICR